MDGVKNRKKDRFKKMTLWFLLLPVVLFSLFPQITYAALPKSTFDSFKSTMKALGTGATGAGFPTTVMTDLPGIADKVELSWEKAMFAGLLGGLVQGASYFMRKMAHDAAVWVAYGGKGQGALIYQEGFGPYIEKVATDAGATAIAELGKPFGLNLCSIPDMELFAQIQIGLQRFYDDADGVSGPTPTCTWREMSSNWSRESWLEKYGSEAMEKRMEQYFDQALKVNETDFGFTLQAMAKIDRIRAREKEAMILDREEGDGFKAVANMVAGYIKTPGSIIHEEAKAVTGKHQGELSVSQIASLYGTSALEIIPMAGSVFLNTLASQLLDQLMGEGLVPEPTSSNNASILEFYGEALVDNKNAAEKAFNFFFTAVPQKQLSSFDMAAQFLACPSNAGINNCVIDSGLHDALIRARNGQPLTIREALNEGLLHADWELIPPSRLAENTNPRNCLVGKYCYSNIQKLRKVRVVPLGFEIAALKSDPDHPWKLGDVVKGFDDCAEGNVPDSNHPYCHLIDPNWTLRIPETRCEANVYTAELLDPSTPNRRQECVDVSTCINEGPNGECLGKFGYCLKEKKVWELPGESCPAEFNTCKTYKTNDNKLVSYLSRTVDFGTCSASTVGCAAYSTDQVNGNWVTSDTFDALKKKEGINSALYFNQTISQYTCSESDEGCTAFYGASLTLGGTYTKDSSKLIHLKKAPSYLSCYDIDPATPEIDWPTTKADLNAITTDPACAPFAQVCLPEEVGCQAYVPKDGSQEIPGVVGNNACAAECVGYDAYKQEATYFEQSVYPQYIIPTNGTQCSDRYAGCDEFTNIDSLASGGEQKEYYVSIKHCEKPSGDNSKTYYSWEGSATEGYVLKVHNLLQLSAEDATSISSLDSIANEIKTQFVAGSPAYAEDSSTKLNEAYGFCNETVYNAFINSPNPYAKLDPDCRALYDDAGNIYYRLMSRTVTVSSACRTIRKTISNFFNDSDYTNEQACEAKGGLFDTNNNACQRCTNGGRYQVDPITNQGACVYQAIPGEGESVSCPAIANGCRAYSGPTGAYAKNIVDDIFEPIGEGDDALNAAKAGWQTTEGTATVANESVLVGLRSLQVNAGTLQKEIAPNELVNNEWYELTFWARGSGQSLTISFASGTDALGNAFTFDPLTNTSIPAGITNDWKKYTLGPVQFKGSSGVTTTLRFVRSGSGTYFIDNVLLRQVKDKHWVIKDSWKTAEGYDVPVACDATPGDVFPGAALGCREYTEKTTNRRVYATGFESLCREKAIGCQPLFDTFNTVGGENEEKVVLSKAVCVLESEVTSPSVCIVNLESIKYSCSVSPGNNSCYIEEQVIVPDSFTLNTTLLDNSLQVVSKANNTVAYKNPNFIAVTNSSIVIPADTPSTTPIYLTVAEQFLCNAAQRGCMRVGKELRTIGTNAASSTYEYSEGFVRNDPSLYTGGNGTLCRADQVGCSQFSSNNQVSFFKDPAQTGSTFCEYKSLSPENGIDRSGWYKVGIGTCSTSGTECREDSHCASGETCQNKGTVACYEEYKLPGGENGIFSNEAEGYNGYVGVCQEEYSGCTELVDKNDTAPEHPEGKTYYAIYDNRLTARTGECQGQISLEEGCVLFDRTELPNKLYNTSESYKASELKPGDTYGLVTPTSDSNNDANIILKVNRDRQCSEWLDCRASEPFVTNDGKVIDLCLDYRACRASNGLHCTSFVEPFEKAHYENFLTEQIYINRDVSWAGDDYTGYSLFNQYQINNFQYVAIGDEGGKNKQVYLAYRFHPKNIEDASDGVTPEQVAAASCITADNTYKNDGETCGFDTGGRCFEGQCYYPIDKKAGFSSSLNTDNLNEDLLSAECKAYPERDAPFSRSIVPAGKEVRRDTGREKLPETKAEDIKVFEFPQRLAGFEGANVCQDGNCSCEYVKAEYIDGSRMYWSTDEFSSKDNLKNPGVCSDGERVGLLCYVDGDCPGFEDQDVEPFCEKKITKQSTHIGMYGYCLERDLSRGVFSPQLQDASHGCLTWLPLDVNPNGLDTYNNYVEAGFEPSLDVATDWSGGLLYCSQSTAVTQTDNQINGVQLGEITYQKDFPICRVSPNYDYYYVTCPYNNELTNETGESECIISNADKASEKGCEVPTQNYTNCVENAPTGIYVCDGIKDIPNFNYTFNPDYCEELDNGLKACGKKQPLCTSIPIVQKACINTFEKVGQVDDNTIKTLGEDFSIGNVGFSCSATAVNCSFWVEDCGGEANFVRLPDPNTYGSLVCKNSADFDAKKIAKLLQEKEDLMVLRVEAGTDLHPTVPNQTNITQAIVYPDQSSPGGMRNIPLKFAPMDEAFLAVDNFQDRNDGDGHDTVQGRIVLRHPPRDGFNGRYETPMTAPGRRDDDSTGEQGDGPEISYVDGTIMSPGPNLYPVGVVKDFVDKKLYRSHFESVMNLSELEKVYFMPLRYFDPLCLDCVAPELLSKDIFFDFSSIDANGYTFQEVQTNVVSALHEGKYFYGYDFGFKNNKLKPMFAYAYKIDRDDEGAEKILDTYYKSTVSKGDPSEIEKRYVMVLFRENASIMSSDPNATAAGGAQWQSQLAWLPNNPALLHKGGATLLRDPFDTDSHFDPNMDVICKLGHSGTWLAIAMDFNKEGAFLGYSSRFCMAESLHAPDKKERYGMNFAVLAELKNMCTQVRNVYDEDAVGAAEKTNKAWTNRVWVDTENNLALARAVGKETAKDAPQRDWYLSPYGSISSKWSLTDFNTEELFSATKIKALAFEAPEKKGQPSDGVPYACATPFSTSFSVLSADKTCLFPQSLGDHTNVQGDDYIRRLFVKSFDVYNIARTAAAQFEVQNILSDEETDHSDDLGASALFVPQIYSLNPATCFGSRDGRCTAGEKDNITVSGKNGTMTDYDNDGKPDEATYANATEADVHIAMNVFFAKTQFFAFADDNRMPINRIRVDWGDDFVTNGFIEGGKYKNYKPYCEYDGDIGHCGTGADEMTLLTCKTDDDCPVDSGYSCIKKIGDGSVEKGYVNGKPELDSFNVPRFGDSDRACFARPFEATFTYYCSEVKANERYAETVSELGDNESSWDLDDPKVKAISVVNLSERQKQRLRQMGFDPDVNDSKKVCIFKPRVQVLDNWGWCNGSCGDAQSSGGESCYADEVTKKDDECDPKNDFPSHTLYKGSIIIIPE